MENIENKEDSNWALHAIIFKKDKWNLENAKNEVEKFMNPNKHFYRETKLSFRFRNIPKTKFKLFKTKKLKNGITLIFGELKDEHKHLKGSGIRDLINKPINMIKDFFSPKKFYNNKTTKMLSQYGNVDIKELTIARTPIMDIINKSLNIISLGKWDKLLKDNGYDKLFHLALIANIGSNKNLIIEKNEVINVSTDYKTNKDTEFFKLYLNNKKFSINHMLDNTRKRIGDNKFFLYDGLKNNCQVFCKECLITENLYTKQAENFLFQSMENIIKNISPSTYKIMNFTTNTGGLVNKMLGKAKIINKTKNKKIIDDLYNEFILLNDKYVKLTGKNLII